MWPFRDKRIKLLTPPGINANRKKTSERFEWAPGKFYVQPRLIIPDTPMCRVVYDDGTTSGWNVYEQKRKRIIAIETRVYSSTMPLARGVKPKVG